MGLKSRIAGSIKLDLKEHVDRKLKRFMSDGIAFNYLAMKEAVEDSGLSEEQVSDIRTGLIMGNGGGSPETIVSGADSLREKGKSKSISRDSINGKWQFGSSRHCI